MKKIKKQILFVAFVILVPILLFVSNGLIVFNSGLKENQEMHDFFKLDKELSQDYSEREITHIEEVKGLVGSLNSIIRLGLFLFILLGLSLFLKSKKYFAKGLFYGGLLTISLVIIFVIITFVNFDFLFTVFHKLFFKTDYWLLNSGSKLLQQFPIEFWMQGFRNLFIYVFVESLIISSLGYFIKKSKLNHLSS